MTRRCATLLGGLLAACAGRYGPSSTRDAERWWAGGREPVPAAARIDVGLTPVNSHPVFAVRRDGSFWWSVMDDTFVRVATNGLVRDRGGALLGRVDAGGVLSDGRGRTIGRVDAGGRISCGGASDVQATVDPHGVLRGPHGEAGATLHGDYDWRYNPRAVFLLVFAVCPDAQPAVAPSADTTAPPQGAAPAGALDNDVQRAR